MFPRSLGSSMFFPAIPQMQAEWGCSQTTLLLGITVYSCCFSIGPPIFAPISETIGRRPIYLLNWIVYTGVMFPIAFSQVLYPSLIWNGSNGLESSHVHILPSDFCISWSRCFHNCRWNIVGFVYSRREVSVYVLFRSDHNHGTMYRSCLWEPHCRQFQLVFSLTFDVNNTRRWVFHIQTIYAAILLVLIVFTLPETFVPKLAQKAHGLNRVPTNAPPLSTRIKVALQRPLSFSPQTILC
jgi:hypothetical protein